MIAYPCFMPEIDQTSVAHAGTTPSRLRAILPDVHLKISTYSGGYALHGAPKENRKKTNPGLQP